MSIWPLTAQPALSVGGVYLTEIAERFGTPVYVLDEEHVRVRCREYAKAMAPHEVAYASKAFWCRAMARWIAEEGGAAGEVHGRVGQALVGSGHQQLLDRCLRLAALSFGPTGQGPQHLQAQHLHVHERTGQGHVEAPVRAQRSGRPLSPLLALHHRP